MRHLNVLSPAPQHSIRSTGIAKSALPTASRLGRCLASPRHGAALDRLSIPSRLILLVFALAVPLNLVIAGVVWGLVNRADQIQRTSLLYAARSIAAGVDAELGKYVALGEALSRSPALLDDNLDAFEAEARRAFPAGEIPGYSSQMQMASSSLTFSPSRGRPCHAAIRWHSRHSAAHSQRVRS
jgi:hypothetical protein